MNVQELKSGLLVASEDQPKPSPAIRVGVGIGPEHPVRGAIRDTLSKLQDDLSNFGQTLHGRLGPHATIEQVAQALMECYNDPTPYTISELSQTIHHFGEVKT